MIIKKEQASFEKLLIVCLLFFFAIGCGNASPTSTPPSPTNTDATTPEATQATTNSEPTSDTGYPGTNNQPQTSGYLSPEESIVVEGVSPNIPDPEIIFPENNPNAGVVGGVLAREITDQGYVPVQPRELILGKIVENNLGEQVLISVAADSQRAQLFATGIFLFSDIPPGDYGIVIDLGFTQFPLLNENGEQILLTIEGGKTIDLGQILVEIPED